MLNRKKIKSAIASVRQFFRLPITVEIVSTKPKHCDFFQEFERCDFYVKDITSESSTVEVFVLPTTDRKLSDVDAIDLIKDATSATKLLFSLFYLKENFPDLAPEEMDEIRANLELKYSEDLERAKRIILM